MENRIPWVAWKVLARVVLTGLGVSALATALIWLVIGINTGVTFVVAGGADDPSRTEGFNLFMANWVAPTLFILLNLTAAGWLVLKVRTYATVHGLLIGLVIAIVSLGIGRAFGGNFDSSWTLAWTFFQMGVGWLGAQAGSALVTVGGAHSTAVEHAVGAHQHEESPELRAELDSLLKEATF